MAEAAATRRKRRHALLSGAALLAGSAVALPAAAQGLFGDAFGGQGGGIGRPDSPFPAPLAPGQGASPGFWQPDFLPDFGGGPPPPGAPPQPFSLRPSLEVQGSATDNVRNSATNRESDFYTTVIPTITAAADTVNLVGAITYAPRLRLYANASDQNRFDHVLRGQGLATLIQDRLFVQFSAVADAQSVFGDFLDTDLAPDSDRNRVQTTSYRISPYYLHRFGDFAEARIGYAFRQVLQRGDAAFEPGETRPFFTSTDFVSHQFFGTLNSGDMFGRFGWTLAASATEFDGDGVYDGAYNRVYAAQVRYAVTRELAVLADAGWQESFYNGTVPFEVNDPIWGLGFRYQPDDRSFLTVRYGQYDGRTNWAANGALDLGPRTRLFLAFSERLSNSGLDVGSSLSSLRVDSLGNLVDSGTGAPAALAFGSPLRSVQSGIFRTRRASAAVSQVWLRDTFSLAVTRSENTPVAVPEGISAFEEETTSFSFGWSRSLDPVTNLSAGARYGFTETPGQSDRQSYALNARLSRALTQSLVGSLRYEFSSREFTGESGRANRNTVTIALRQTF